MWYRLRGLDEPTPEDADSVPDSEKLTKGRPSSDRYGSDEEDGQAVLLPVRRVAEELNWLENFRGFILFGLFFACYFALNTVRLDWWTGHETIKMLEASRDGLKIPALVDTGSLKDANTYLVHGLPEIVVSLKENRCLNCKVGITPINHDMNHLSMGQFICSDFLSIADSDEYPSRDCPAADAAFALNPSATEETTPCCSDATLVRASVAAMAAVGTSVEVPETLEELLGGVDELTSQLLEKHIDESGVLYQVIVSRELRMAGIQYYATWDDKVNAPGRITPKSQFWSYSYDHDVAKDYMLVLVLAFGILSLMHEIVQPWTENVESIRAYVLNPFMLLVEIPTIVLPPLIELLKKEIDISEYTIFVTLLELLLVIRLFEEGEIVPPLRLFVSVLNHAGSMLLKFVVVLFPMIFITAAAQSQLFGPFDDGYADYATSVSRIVRVLTAPPSTEGPIFEHTNLGAQLMYYWRARHAQKCPRPAADRAATRRSRVHPQGLSRTAAGCLTRAGLLAPSHTAAGCRTPGCRSTFVLRLAFGSFLVAILVGAFNKATVSLAADRASMKLPRGFMLVGRPAPFCNSALRVVHYCLTWRVHGVWGSQLIRTLKVAEAEAQVLPVRHLPRDRARPEPTTACGRPAIACARACDRRRSRRGACWRLRARTRLGCSLDAYRAAASIACGCRSCCRRTPTRSASA